VLKHSQVLSSRSLLTTLRKSGKRFQEKEVQTEQTIESLNTKQKEHEKEINVFKEHYSVMEQRMGKLYDQVISQKRKKLNLQEELDEKIKEISSIESKLE
jgi:uncharacterized coiled-coil protein SlyX